MAFREVVGPGLRPDVRSPSPRVKDSGPVWTSMRGETGCAAVMIASSKGTGRISRFPRWYGAVFNDGYSDLSALTGSSRVTRRAGIHDAASATIRKSPVTLRKVTGSSVGTP